MDECHRFVESLRDLVRVTEFCSEEDGRSGYGRLCYGLTDLFFVAVEFSARSLSIGDHMALCWEDMWLRN